MKDEHVQSLEDMLSRTTCYMNQIQDKLKQANEELSDRNQQINEGLRYSAYLQNSIMPSEDQLKSLFTECYLIYSPKDEIGGDTIWLREYNNNIYLASIDCTGHGIPGAMLTMASQFTLNALFEYKKFDEPNEMLYEFINRFKTYMNLNEKIGSVEDSMDMSISIIDKEKCSYKFSSINHHITVLRNKEMNFYKGTTNYYGDLEMDELESINIPLKGNELFFLSSDGYKDQFGGERDKKFSQKRLNILLQSISKLMLSKQKEILVNTLHDWKEGEEQTDDIMCLGFKI